MKVNFEVIEHEGKNHLPIITAALNTRLQKTKVSNPNGFLDQFESQFDTHCIEIAQGLGGTLEFKDTETYVFKFI